MSADRTKTQISTYLKAMTTLARRYDIIVAEPLEAATFSYDPKLGPKLFWDVKTKSYICVLPTGEIIRSMPKKRS